MKQQTTLRVGDKVTTIYGATAYVIAIEPLRVFVAADPQNVRTAEAFNWFHPTKVFKVN